MPPRSVLHVEVNRSPAIQGLAKLTHKAWGHIGVDHHNSTRVRHRHWVSPGSDRGCEWNRIAITRRFAAHHQGTIGFGQFEVVPAQSLPPGSRVVEEKVRPIHGTSL